MRILMIEDEARIASFVKSGLSEGFVVELALDTDPDSHLRRT